MKRKNEYYRGCLIGGAIGDALGWPVEFSSYNEIIRTYGKNGITDMVYDTNNKAQITDDTQMILFTAEGLLRARVRLYGRGICHPPSVVYQAYLRWLRTQNAAKPGNKKPHSDGWLIGVPELYARRAPGMSCLSALESKRMGTIENPVNDSKGCGGVMRVAPAGLFVAPENAFELAAECAAITHGHPDGYLSAGVLARIIAGIIEGADIETAVNDALNELKKHSGHKNCHNAVTEAVKWSKDDMDDTDVIKMLGEGWVGEEALAIAVYCSLKYRNDFERAVIAAVNHSGDSDSTGAITGNILGAWLGIDAIPLRWRQNLELSDVIIRMSDDLLTGYMETDEWQEMYPGC